MSPTRQRRSPLALAVALAVALTLTATSTVEVAAESSWTELTREQGVIVSIKERADGGLPVFRGVTVIRASVYEILAVLNDVEKNTEWMAACREARTLKVNDAYNRIIYNRTAAPWPVDDRDTVLKTKIKVRKDRKAVTVAFHNIKGHVSPVDGVVRTPRLRGFFRLVVLGDDKTRVTYQIDADPGGMLPDWLVEKASEELPLKTLSGLRKRVKQTRGKYDGFLKKWDPAKNGGKQLDEH